MFVAWRDLRFAKGRFALMGSVVLLITLLVGLLSGLTAGLARENVSAVTGLPASYLAFAAPAGDQKVSFANSQVPESAWLAWRAQPGVRSAEPLGIRTTNAVSGERTAAVSVFGVDPAGGLAPRNAGLTQGRVVLAEKAAKELGGLTAGARVRIGPLELTVAAVAGTAAYSHTPVVWTDLADWQRLGNPGTSVDTLATVVAVSGSSMDLAAADRAAATRAQTVEEALGAIGSYQAENGSLQLMRGFLFAISALVIGAFFTVWTIQRSADIAVLKALGASTPYLLRDALGQAVVMLAVGTGLGTALAAGFGALVSGGDVPFVLDAATVLVPAAIMIALGALGAALSIRRITAVDPLTALGSAR
ncbi:MULTISPECIES: ABC transporter permease [Streptomyces]|uniref:ABC transporter permease n=1 Tax=Streptomyces TaxID=1883 RepID=UPI0004C657EF|nr:MULTISPECIES: ABC transporter permease [Streptomyces]KOU29613.1 ABC transporter substrate-binding protein [Streptomyces sp. WM6373]KOU67839.1 ABC transporter substrate-binding protein [Streptomyces sp. IGB124]KOU70182.1 ABC transporter substrate-binding protein [Streptomyces sp. XY66]KOV16613.1 ABC transporter substrate-binding protein [Streptomyces sp. XY413]KOV33884.1 ABC transporter substrate-binding protein [Streptomyces sp. H021]